ncbi:hypothetical protein [Silvibacterium dinghuense]|uniref:Uncharacterized protein n=1 Tax=Silvibacterium dinghuense TaxID=1560006 RepID=A0A4Q1S739_9BACT|nr:hypothetical protein [Silvibacterium dinghuense]RXS92798.1 hypothetical protein ESZ00_19910 [Silvibacterium dinghuense]
MTDYTAYWGATCVRGIVALVAGGVIAFCSAINATLLLMPVGTVISFVVLSAYIVADSAIALASSFMLPHQHSGRVALRFQGLIGTMIGIGCFIASQSEAKWFLYLAALQAFCVAVTEYLSARDTVDDHRSKWCYASSVIAAVSCLVLLIFRYATGHLLSWLLYSYLWSFGLNLFVLSCHMLFDELRPSRSHAGS